MPPELVDEWPTQVVPVVPSPGRPVPPAEETTVLPAVPADEAPGRPPRRRRPRKVRRPAVRRARRVVGIAVLLFLFVVGYSLGGALSRPGNDPTAARLAEWARDHGLGGVVTFAEKQQYKLDAPKTGGTLANGIPKTGKVEEGAAPAKSSVGSAQPSPIAALPVLDAQAGEGQWQVLRTVKGAPALQVAYVRPDTEHSSYLSAVAWMDPKLLRFDQRPGIQDPGKEFVGHPDVLDPADPSIVAGFNSGFRLGKDSRGGWYLAGQTIDALRDGAASFVTYSDGTAKIGAWGQGGLTMTPDVVGVRQNLDLLVHEGKADPSVNENNTPKWGYTLGNKLFIDRSGIGVRADGTLVYVAGPALSVATLADLLVRAGAVTGMSLDINPTWTIFTYFTPNASGPSTVTKLNPSMTKGIDTYTTPSTRDFFAVTARS